MVTITYLTKAINIYFSERSVPLYGAVGMQILIMTYQKNVVIIHNARVHWWMKIIIRKALVLVGEQLVSHL